MRVAVTFATHVILFLFLVIKMLMKNDQIRDLNILKESIGIPLIM
jgi:hypothetical protein